MREIFATRRKVEKKIKSKSNNNEPTSNLNLTSSKLAREWSNREINLQKMAIHVILQLILRVHTYIERTVSTIIFLYTSKRGKL